MRIIVFGAGGIGGVVGGHLALAREDVVLIARQKHVEAIRGGGLRLVTPAGTHVLNVTAVTSIREVDWRADDVVFLSMKGQDTEQSLKDLKIVAPDVPLFCFQNGVRNEEIAIRYFEKVYGVMVQVGTQFLVPGEVIARRDPPGYLVIGRYPIGSDELAEAAAASLRHAGFLVKVSPEVMPYKWGKLMFNLSNAPEAITDTKGGEVGAVSDAAERELETLLARADTKWVSWDELKKSWPEVTNIRATLPMVPRDSTWQSLARGTGKIETDFINGEVVRLAKKLGCEAPINDGLVRIIAEMAANHEPPGKYTPSQLCEILGIKKPGA